LTQIRGAFPRRSVTDEHTPLTACADSQQTNHAREVEMKFRLALSLAFLCGPFLVHAAPAPQAIRVAYTSVTGNRAPFWIAKEAKLFEKHGLQVELIYLQSVAVGMPALLGGDFQILAGGVAAYLSAASRGAKLILFGTFGPTPYILFTRPEIQTTAQLKGAMIGVNRIGASDYYALRRLLQKLELSPDRDVKIITAGSPLDRLISVERGSIYKAPLEPIWVWRPIQ
jgi:ABC-type nitrate/sulfonate/bicarbonate transport system substrate-binding protein